MSAIDELTIPEICHTRMEEWAKQMAERSCTPIMAMGIGHDDALGELHLFTPENLSDQDMVLFLMWAIRELDKRRKAA